MSTEEVKPEDCKLESEKKIFYCEKEEALRPKTVYCLAHVVEIRFEGRKEPRYECKLCGFNTEMAAMIERLSGYKHRRAYISKEFPDKMKRKTADVKECKVSFLR